MGRISSLAANWVTAAALGAGTLGLGAAAVIGSSPAAAYGPTSGSKGTTTTSITVKIAAAQHHPLAFTGTDAAITTLAGAAAIGAGGVVVLATRKRKARQ